MVPIKLDGTLEDQIKSMREWFGLKEGQTWADIEVDMDFEEESEVERIDSLQ